MTAPVTAWRERVAPGEAERHADDARRLVAVQQRLAGRQGHGRALHRKGLLALRATLRVHDALPDTVRHGLFAAPGAHMAWIRLSNGGPSVQDDRRPDVRGFALRVFGVGGPSALGGHIDHQDFTLIDRPAFAFADSRPFVALVEAASQGTGALLRWALAQFGPIGMWAQMKRLAAMQAKRFGGFANERFFSAAPLACGPQAVRVRLLPPTGQPPASDHGSWGDDLRGRLARGPLVWRLQLQRFVDEARTPIEDASVDWPESVSPYLTVADLVVESQPADEAFTRQIEASTFDPWQALEAHRPLGEVMRARKVAYFESQKARGAA
ncbi:MAG: catalase [Rubrivivax sp.]